MVQAERISCSCVLGLAVQQPIPPIPAPSMPCMPISVSYSFKQRLHFVYLRSATIWFRKDDKFAKLTSFHRASLNLNRTSCLCCRNDSLMIQSHFIIYLNFQLSSNILQRMRPHPNRSPQVLSFVRRPGMILVLGIKPAQPSPFSTENQRGPDNPCCNGLRCPCCPLELLSCILWLVRIVHCASTSMKESAKTIYYTFLQSHVLACSHHMFLFAFMMRALQVQLWLLKMRTRQTC